MAQTPSYGSVLSVSTDGNSYTEVGGIVDGWDTSLSREEVPLTLFADQWKTFGISDIDPGEVNFEVAHDNLNASCVFLNTHFVIGTNLYWSVTYPNAPENPDYFRGFVKERAEMVKKSEMLKMKVTIRRSGEVELTTTGGTG